MNVALTNDQALVMFDLLARMDERGQTLVVDAAEQHVLWKVEAQLENQLVDLFDPNDAALLRDAKARISIESGAADR